MHGAVWGMGHPCLPGARFKSAVACLLSNSTMAIENTWKMNILWEQPLPQTSAALNTSTHLSWECWVAFLAGSYPWDLVYMTHGTPSAWLKQDTRNTKNGAAAWIGLSGEIYRKPVGFYHEILRCSVKFPLNPLKWTPHIFSLPHVAPRPEIWSPQFSSTYLRGTARMASSRERHVSSQCAWHIIFGSWSGNLGMDQKKMSKQKSG